MNKPFYRQWMQLSLIWVLIALVPVGRAYLNLTYDASFYIIILIAGLIIIPFLILWLKLLQAKKVSWAVIVIIQLALAILPALAFHYYSDEGLTKMKMRISMQQLQQMSATQQTTFHLLSGNSYTVFSSLMLLSGFALLIEYNEQLRQKRTKESQLQVNLAKSQVKALQSELQPHFIFNTLHSVSSLMQFDKDRAERLIEGFSILLRNYLDIISETFYTLEEEVFFLREYIEVQKLRHGGNIELDMNIPPACLHIEVPVVLLQPVIENSIKHGWTNRDTLLKICVEVVVTGKNALQINVQDNGTAVKINERPGIGIRNLKDRLDLLYPGSYTFFENQQTGYQTQITIPIKP